MELQRERIYTACSIGNSRKFLKHDRTPISEGGSPNGQRKWQNEDGTWTEAGKARRRELYAQKTSSLITSSTTIAKPFVTRGAKRRDAAENKIHNALAKQAAANMTNQELQDIVKRMNLENQYINLTAPETHKREERAKAIIEGLSAMAGVVTAGAILINVLKKRADSDIEGK